MEDPQRLRFRDMRRLIHDAWQGRGDDGLQRFAQDLITLLLVHTYIHARLRSAQEIEFRTPDETEIVPVRGAKGKLRSVCARLAVLVSADGIPESLYGGIVHGALPIAGTVRDVKLEFQNTAELVEFRIGLDQ